ncbi:hypothetical protein OKW41_006141 [Paraburkholderia sp. UCT70]|uniref:hypothetical protein n=1 Tax=Paraburkholderia sp. UCT70 TaxID=2991068 RepID=UPI003D1F4613
MSGAAPFGPDNVGLAGGRPVSMVTLTKQAAKEIRVAAPELIRLAIAKALAGDSGALVALLGLMHNQAPQVAKRKTPKPIIGSKD